MIEQVTKCDGCGKVKGEANHWLVGVLYYKTFYGFARWGTPATDDQTDGQHFCGMECALKRLNEHLEAK